MQNAFLFSATAVLLSVGAATAQTTTVVTPGQPVHATTVAVPARRNVRKAINGAPVSNRKRSRSRTAVRRH